MICDLSRDWLFCCSLSVICSLSLLELLCVEKATLLRENGLNIKQIYVIDKTLKILMIKNSGSVRAWGGGGASL